MFGFGQIFKSKKIGAYQRGAGAVLALVGNLAVERLGVNLGYYILGMQGRAGLPDIGLHKRIETIMLRTIVSIIVGGLALIEIWDAGPVLRFFG